MRHILLGFIILISLTVQAQYGENYEPLKLNGQVPSDFYFDVQAKSKADIAANTILETDDAERFYTGVNYEVLKELQSGSIYFNDPFSKYLNQIADKVLASKPSLKSEVKIYASRSASINAKAFSEGHIFINIGLINAMDSEDQLAFILAHEISHYEKKHSINTYKRREDISDEEIEAYNPDGERFRNLRYSRENEFNADAAGLQMLITSGYDANQAPAALRNLVELDSLDGDLDVEKLFNGELFTVDTSWINEKSIRKWKKRAIRNSEGTYVPNSEEDIYLTHPDIEKRALALEEILKATEYEAKGEKPKTALSFKEIKELSAFELVNNSLNSGMYAYTIYRSLVLLNTYPDNLFLNLSIVKSLYWLAHLAEKEALDEVLVLRGLATDHNYYKLNAVLSKPGISEYKKLAYGFHKSLSDKFKGKDDFMFYQCLLTEKYLGKDAAMIYYAQYLAQFPTGNNIVYAAQKLN